MESTNVSKTVIVALLMAAVLTAQPATPYKSNVLEAKQAHMADQFKPEREEKWLLHTFHNTYVRANYGPVSSKVDTQILPGSTEVWRLQFLSNGRVMLKSIFDTYLRALPGMPSNCDLVNKPSDATTFEFINNNDGTFSFKTIYNTFVRPNPNEGGLVDVQTFIGTWERFTLFPDGSTSIPVKVLKEEKYNLKTIWNTYPIPYDEQDHAFILGQRDISPRAGWTIQYLDNGRVAIKSAFGTYIRAHPGGDNAIVELKKGSISPWETYELVHNNDDGSVSFRTVHSTYLRPREDLKLRMDQHPDIGSWERMRLVPVA